ncbi:MAG: TCP-1/cpn60 chaperonin family protein [Thermomicrobiales bacterium]
MRTYGRQRVRLAPTSHRDIDRGVRMIVEAIRPTLGPIPRAVAVARPVRTLAPDLFDDGATIARRISALPDVYADPGAMLVRGMLWRLHEEIGDGTASAATLFASILAAGRRAIAAGVPAQPLRSAIEELGDRVFADVMDQARPCSDRADLVSIARSVCHDDELAELLADCADVVGETGQIDLRLSRRHESWREFVQGSYWESGLLSATAFGDAARQRTEMHDAAILLTDLAIDDPRDMLPVLEAVHASGAGGLLVIAQSIVPALAGLLHANSDPGTFPIVAVKPPVHAPRGTLEDLAIMTGGRVFHKDAGDSLRRFAAGDLGSARTAWATRQQFGLTGGQGDPHAVRCRVDALQRTRLQAGDKEIEADTVRRLGVFQGTSATVWVGARSDLEAKTRMERATRTVPILRAAMRHGVVPGGGAALLHCQHGVEALQADACDEIGAAAARIVHASLEAPAATLLENCGFAAPPILARIREHGPGAGFDAVNGRLGNMHEMGIVDPAPVIATAARTAIRSAALALTIDVVVHTNAADASADPE